MKIRNSFVSNSSSSSFIAVGFRADEDKIISLFKKQAEKWNAFIKQMKGEGFEFEDMVWDFISDNKDSLNVGYLSDDGDYIVGKILADVSSEDGGYLDSISLSTTEISEIIKDVSEKTGVPEEEIKFMIGTRAC